MHDDGKELHGRDAEENDTCLRDVGGTDNGKQKKKNKKDEESAVDDDDDDDDSDDRPANGFTRRIDSMGLSMSAAAARRPRQLVIIVAVLILLALVLLIAIIVLAVWPSCPASPKPIRPLCASSPECLKASATLLSRLNTSVDACSDFYEFACGGRYPSTWSSSAVGPRGANRGTIGVLADARFEFMRRAREIVDTLEHTPDFQSPRWKIKAFFQSCMDMDGVDSAGDATVKRRIDELRGWKPIGTWQSQAFDWAKVLRVLHSSHGVFPFFKVDVVPDEVIPNLNVLQISPSGLGLPHYSYYFRSPDNKVIRAYQRLMTDLATLLGATGDRAVAFADEVFHFEKRIAEMRSGFVTAQTDRRPADGFSPAATALKTKITIAELRQISQRINWVDHLKAILPQAYISDNTLVYVTDKRYLIDVSTILSTTDQGSLNSYLIWTLVFHYAPSLSKSYRNAMDTYERVYTGATASQPRWEFCIESTYSVFSLALTSLYVQSDISSQSFYLATDLYRSVRLSFLQALDNISWMEERSKIAAKAKTKSLKEKITYRDFAVIDETLNAYYDQMSVLKTDFLQNVQNGAIFRHLQLEKLIMKPSQENLELEMLTKENIYDSDMKGIVLSPFLLQEGLFDLSYPRYLLYGSLGSYFGQGFTLDFEDAATLFARGRPTFWNNKTETEFTRIRRCVAGNYAEHFQIDGNRTVDNDIADIVGVRQAFKAFHHYELREGKNDPQIPGTSLNAEQLFFVSYAQTMCSVSRPEQLENDLELASHPPDKYRVLVTLSLVPEFADAFQCSRGTPANPHSSCNLW